MGESIAWHFTVREVNERFLVQRSHHHADDKVMRRHDTSRSKAKTCSRFHKQNKDGTSASER
jgi:hypothetical protein